MARRRTIWILLAVVALLLAGAGRIGWQDWESGQAGTVRGEETPPTE